MSEAHIFAIGIALAWLAGIRAYLTVFGLGIAGWFGWLQLPGALDLCQSPWVLGISGLLAAVEFGTDKIPGVDSVWDLLQTLLRVPAGAFLASAALAGTDGDMSVGWAAAGGTVALLSHSLKTGTRALINTSPEPFSNAATSVGEDTLALGALALLFAHPWLVLGVLVLLTCGIAAVVWWFARRLWRWRKRPAKVAVPDNSGAGRV